MRKLFKLFKGLFKLAIIVIIVIVVLVVWFGKDDKREEVHEEPKTYERQEEVKEVEEKPQEEEIEVEVEQEVEVQEEVVEEETVSEDDVRPEFRQSMESLEAFFDEYVEFMELYKEDSTSLSMLSRYAEFLTKYEEAMNKMDAIGEQDMTTAEEKLFIDTQLRIEKKLADAVIG